MFSTLQRTLVRRAEALLTTYSGPPLRAGTKEALITKLKRVPREGHE